jgi:MFS family permease
MGVTPLNRFARVRNALDAYPPLLRLLAVGSFLNVAGSSFLWPLNQIYIHNVLGKPLTVAGNVLLLHAGGAVLGQFAGGVLYDRIGARPVLLAGVFSSAALICLPGLFSNWTLYVAVMLLYGFAVTVPVPALQAMVARAWPEGGRKGYNFLYVANNLGVAVGTAVGGVVAGASFKFAFLAASLLFVVYGIYASFAIHDPTGPAARPDRPVGPELAGAREPEAAPIPWVPILALLLGMMVSWIVYVQWQGAIAVHMTASGTPTRLYGLLWTLNGALIVLGQPLSSRVVRLAGTFANQLRLGILLYAAAFSVLFTADRYPIYVVGMVLLTFGEMLLLPVIPAAVAQVSPPSRRGFLQGFVGAGMSGGRMLGPLLGGLLFDHTSFRMVLLVMTATLSIPFLAFSVYAAATRHVETAGG